MKIDNNYQYLLECFPGDTIFNRYSAILTQLVDIIEKMDLGNCVRIDTDLLALSVLDYFADIARLKQFHNISKTNVQKIYSYGLYWLLRRHPVQIITQVSETYLHINEKIAIALTFPKILEEMGIDYKDCSEAKEITNNFIDLLYYNLKFRVYTPQSLELMIEAFFCGCKCCNVRG